MSKIIFLNGASSAGKTSLGKSIQHLSDEPWLLSGIDHFINMMPDKYTDFGDKASEGFSFTPSQNEHGPTMVVKSGPLGKTLFSLLPRFIGMLADAGLHMILDEVLLEDDPEDKETLLRQYTNALKDHTLYLVHVVCPLSIMQEREILRGNRSIGLANYSASCAPQSIEYDITIDTSAGSSFTLARTILNFM